MSIKSQNIQTYSISQMTDEKINQLINQKLSFLIKDIDQTKLGGVVSLVEKAIESKGLNAVFIQKIGHQLWQQPQSQHLSLFGLV